jgi:hypothetical protein
MNSRFFVCTDCKAYIDAGYRWAYWLLEHPGVVRMGEPCSAEAVFAAADYWRPQAEESSRWLVDHTLPAVRDFLTEHARHKLLYSDLDVDGDVFDGYTQIQTNRSA